MKLEVGMYVRTIGGIERLKKENDNGWFFEKSMIIKPDNIEKYIIKASFNIIDLIEVGDYVNGIRVGYINKGEDYLYALTDENTIDVICGYDSDGFTKPLHSIVTKEQFEQMEYKVGE